MKKLLNPFALVFEGFLLGACIFVATGDFAGEPSVRSAEAAVASVAPVRA